MKQGSSPCWVRRWNHAYVYNHRRTTHPYNIRCQAPTRREEHQVGGITKRKAAGLFHLPSFRLQAIQEEENKKGMEGETDRENKELITHRKEKELYEPT